MKIQITVRRKQHMASRQELMEVQLALLDLFSVLDGVFTEDDALSKSKRRMSLGRCYESWKRCRATLDPTFNPKSHDRTMKYGSMPIKGGLSRDA